MNGQRKNKPFGYLEKSTIQLEDFVREKVHPKRLGIVVSFELINSKPPYWSAGVVFDGRLEYLPVFLLQKA